MVRVSSVFDLSSLSDATRNLTVEYGPDTLTEV